MNTKLKREHRKNGLCYFCKEEVSAGSYCEKHLIKRRLDDILRSAKKRKTRKESGACSRCGKKLHEYFDTGSATCIWCREAKRLWRK